MPKNLLHQSDWMLVNQADEKTVEIDITGIIGGSFWEDEGQKTVNTREKMRSELKAIAEISASKIIVNIDSPGGSVSHGLSIHDLLAQHPAEKETRITGLTGSIATVIAQAGTVRKMSDNALYLIHHAMNVYMGNVNDIEAGIEELKIVDTKIRNIYIKRGIDAVKVDELMNANNGNGRFIDAKEAKELKFIDEVIEPTKAAAVYDRELLNKLKYPEIPIDMTKKSEETKSLFNTIKDAVIAVFKAEDKEAQIPEVVNNKLAEFEDKLKELEDENNTLTAKVDEANKEIAAKEAEVKDFTEVMAAKNTEIENLTSEVNQLKASSTHLPGPVGKEGDDQIKTGDPELNDIINHMKNELSEIRPDNEQELYQEDKK